MQRTDRLGQYIEAPRLEAALARLGVVVTGEGHRHRRQVVGARELAQNVEAILASQTEVEQYHVGILGPRDIHRLPHVEGGAHPVASLLQEKSQRIDDQRAVLHQQYMDIHRDGLQEADRTGMVK